MIDTAKHMDIVYCTDDNFVPVCAVSVVSVLENKGDENITFYIIENHISASSKKFLQSILRRYIGNGIKFVSFPDLDKLFKCEIKYKKEHISVSTYGRLFISSVLGKDVKRVIYLDCDTIVLGSLWELYTFDIKEKVIGGVDDCKSKAYRKVLGLSDTDYYINAGVLLVNMDKWRELQCELKIISYIEQHNGRIHFEDQGAINASLNRYIYLLPMKFNVMSHNFDMSYGELMAFRRPMYPYTKEMIEAAKCKPIIIHYTTSFLTYGRVWHANCKHKRKDIFDKYAKLADVYGRFGNYKGSTKKRLRFWVIRKLPHRLVIMMAGIAHEWIEPVKYTAIMRKGQR